MTGRLVGRIAVITGASRGIGAAVAQRFAAEGARGEAAVSDDPEIARILREHLHDPSSSFSVGSYGAIAEFHRDIDEPLAIDESEALTVATKRGALRIEMTSDVKPRAYETLSKPATSVICT